MGGFVKLDGDIVQSSLWIDRDLRSVFITSLVLAEPFEVTEPIPQLEVRGLELTGWSVPPGWYGFVRAAGGGIVRTDGLDHETGLAMLEKLGNPDPDSRSQAFDGRRMVRVDGGYIILNYFLYRDRDYTAADRMKRLRNRKKGDGVTAALRCVTRNVTQAEDRVTESRGQSTEIKYTHADEIEAFVSTLPEPSRKVVSALARSQRNPSAWLASMAGMVEGMGGAAVSPAELSVALTEIAASDASATPANVRAFLRRAKKDAVAEINGGRKLTIGEDNYIRGLAALGVTSDA